MHEAPGHALDIARGFVGVASGVSRDAVGASIFAGLGDVRGSIGGEFREGGHALHAHVQAPVDVRGGDVGLERGDVRRGLARVHRE